MSAPENTNSNGFDHHRHRNGMSNGNRNSSNPPVPRTVIQMGTDPSYLDQKCSIFGFSLGGLGGGGLGSSSDMNVGGGGGAVTDNSTTTTEKTKESRGGSSTARGDRVTSSSSFSAATAATTATTSTPNTSASTIQLNDPDPNVEDILLARELNQLSFQERTQILEGVHGVAPTIEENNDFVEECLSQLDLEISKIRKRSLYDKALFLSPRKVNSKKFRLMFLRSEQYDPVKAATRLVKHFQYKVELFGEDKIVKDITLDDLDDDDMYSLLSGGQQVLPKLDASGRAIYFRCDDYFTFRTWKSQLRAIWYQVASALEDETVQRNGLVLVIYQLGQKKVDREQYTQLLLNHHLVKDGLPFYSPAIHYCYETPALRPAMLLYRVVIGKFHRLRFRDHCGTHLECQYTLMGYGITQNSLPIDADGKLKKERPLEYIEKRRRIETQRAQDDEERRATFMEEVMSAAGNTSNNDIDPDSNVYEAPEPNDILLGRGRPYQEYSGNLMLADLIDKERPRYQGSNRSGKTKISREVLRIIKEELHGKFLKKDETTGLWIEQSDEVAREKISHSFRTWTAKMKKERDDHLKGKNTTNTTTEGGNNNPYSSDEDQGSRVSGGSSGGRRVSLTETYYGSGENQNEFDYESSKRIKMDTTH